jgi:DNA repair exonuclease SbcCD nuclease subunit
MAEREIVIVHSSDLHLDVPYNAEEHTDLLWPIRTVLRTAQLVGADLVLLAGDSFDHNRQPLSIVDDTAQCIRDSKLPVVVLPGNHDPLTPDSVWRRGGLADPNNVTVLGLHVEQAAHFPQWDLEIWGHAHTDYYDMSPMREPRPRSTRWQVMMAHGHYEKGPLEPDRLYGSWLFGDEEIEATGADYVALGHWNRPVKVLDGKVKAYYSGSPDLAKTVNVIRLSPSGTVQVDRQPICEQEEALWVGG